MSVIVLVSLLVTAGCDITTPNESKSQVVVKTTLTDALTAAKAVNTATVVGSASGNVSQEAKDAFTAVIAKAQAVADDSKATQKTVDAAVVDLNAAKTTFTAAIVTAVPVTKTTLTDAIAAANTLNAAHTVGTGFGNIPDADKVAYTAAIAAAQAVVDDSAATQVAVETAVTTLAAATSAFNSAIVSEIVINGNFAVNSLEYDTHHAGIWTWWAGSGGVATVSLASEAAVVNVTNVGSEWWNIQLMQEQLAITAEGTYVVSFTASSNVPTDIRLEIAPTNVAVSTSLFNFRLTTVPTTYTASFNVSGLLSGAMLKINYGFGNVTTSSVASIVTLDNVSLKLGSELAGSILTVHVTDGSVDVAGASVSYEPVNIPSEVAVTTNATGNAVLVLKNRLYKVTVTKMGFIPLTQLVNMTADATLNLVLVAIVPPATTEYLYSTAGTVDIIATLGDGWGTGTGVTLNDTTNATYNPSIKLASSSDMWGGGPGVCLAMTGAPEGFTIGFTKFDFKIRTTDYAALTTIKVKFPGATTPEITYSLSGGTALTDGWIQMSIPLSGYGTIPATIVECAILEFASGSGTVYVTDICLVP